MPELIQATQSNPQSSILNPQPPSISIIGKHEGIRSKSEDKYKFRLGEDLQIKVVGDKLKEVTDELKNSKPLVLYFDGEPVATLKSPPETVIKDQEILLNFSLIRDSENKDNRETWDRLFKKKNGFLMKIRPSIAIGNTLLVVQTESPHEFKFYVAEASDTWWALAICLVLFVVTFIFVASKTNMLKDAESNTFSLGKSQMAFWGLLVVLSFSSIWLLTGTMEYIPPQILVLLGISGATGLSAVVIGNSKSTEMRENLKKLLEEKQTLEGKKNAASGSFSAEDQSRLDAVTCEVSEIEKQLKPSESRGFFQDICNDGNGLSFHRLQVAIWTVVLGAVFVRNIFDVMSMPEFSETLLVLMAISNGTYVGFKIPEKQ